MSQALQFPDLAGDLGGMDALHTGDLRGADPGGGGGDLQEELWITPLIIFVLWIAVQLGPGYRHRHHAA